jgi:splicing factor 45
VTATLILLCTLQDPAGAASVRVFVLYSNTSEAAAAVAKLNGRFFGGNVVKATLYDMTAFAANDYNKAAPA